ncbi:hypothetical protein [Agromyces arachidis]|uniref:hypothetical protein n=1 Tax=Agromyces arachidis TaxID=766966 RepID=UPI004055A8A3
MSYPLYPADPTRDPAEPFRRLDTAPTTVAVATSEPDPDPWDAVPESAPVTAQTLAERQRVAFGGPKVGSAFFGVLIAAATAGLLTAVLVVVDALLGLGVIPDPWGSSGVGPVDGGTLGWLVVGVLAAIVLAAFYCGGYVAGRMARFSGVAQGVVVWLWAVVITVIVGVLGALLDARGAAAAIVGQALRRVPIDPDAFALAGILAAVVLLLASLGGAVLGGVVGVRYHRRVDRAGLDD